MIKIRYLQHVPFEDPGFVLSWAAERGYTVAGTRLYTGGRLPSPHSFDLLVVMGGPMSAGDEDRYSWLASEKRFIGAAIGAGKKVLGICLGAQLVADVLGGRVYRNEHSEIGWFPVRLTPEGMESPIFGALPPEFNAFHWHGDTFSLPSECTRMAGSDACVNQAFDYEGRVFGLQFHLETTAEGIGALLENCSSDLKPGTYVQNEFEIRNRAGLIPELNTYAATLLDRMAATAQNR
jgi:GMP synthase-like glutamine amidotransferase